MARSHVLHWRWLSLSRRGDEWGRRPRIWMRGKGGRDFREDSNWQWGPTAGREPKG